jgi:hypothetical protein
MFDQQSCCNTFAAISLRCTRNAGRTDDKYVSSALQGCVFTQDINQAIYISDAMETGTVQVNAAPARGPDVSLTFPKAPSAAAMHMHLPSDCPARLEHTNRIMYLPSGHKAR